MLDKQSFIARRYILLVMLAVVVVIAVVYFVSVRTGASGKLKHVVLISIDTCRADHLGCYGYFRETTPNIDAVGADGVVFSRAFAPVPITLPSHSSMMTGTIPPYHEVRENSGYRLHESNVTLAEILKANGFTTGAFIGAFVLDSQFGLDQGFDSYNDEIDTSEDKELFTFNERSAEATTDLANMWLAEHCEEDFFLFIHYFDPHSHYKLHDGFSFHTPSSSISLVDQYDSEIAYTDHHIGRVIDKLKELKIYDSSLIIITSDHGESLGEHSEKTHGYFIYNSTLHVPLVIRMPFGAKGKAVEDLVGIVDIVPTVCNLFGISAPEVVHGKDLSPYFFNKPDRPEERYLFCESLMPTKFELGPYYGLVNNRWKYIHASRPELYDLKQDFHEVKNLAGEHDQQLRVLKEKLDSIFINISSADASSKKASVDDETIKRLQSLGYISGRQVDEDIQSSSSKADARDFIEVYNFLVEFLVLTSNKKYDEAKNLCSEMLVKWPEMKQVYYYLGIIAKDEGDTLSAEKHLSKYLELAETKGSQSEQRVRSDYEYSYSHNNLGQIYHEKGDISKAVGHYKKALETDLFMPGVEANLGMAYAQLGKDDLAVEYLRKSLVSSPDSPDSLNNLAWVFATSKDVKIRNSSEAVNLAEKACSLAEFNNAEFLDTLSLAYASAGRYEEAVETGEKAVEKAISSGEEVLADEIRTRLKRYKQGKE